jgi:hypothetical protein
MGAGDCDSTAQNNAFFIFIFFDFYIIEMLYIPVTIVNSDHTVESPMVN